MNARIDAAARAIQAGAEGEDWDWCLRDAVAALQAADAVMFSDENIERAVEALVDAFNFPWRYARQEVRILVTALKGTDA